MMGSSGGKKKREKGEGGPNKKDRGSGRTFDWSKHGSRYIALQLSYVGWGNRGFASQEGTDDTVRCPRVPPPAPPARRRQRTAPHPLIARTR